MTKDEFVAQLERAAGAMPSLPVSTALVRHLADQLKKGDPPWWKETAKAWEKRKFVAWTEAWGLFLTALHFEVLGDSECPLFPYFPSCGGTDEADPSPPLAQMLRDMPRGFFDNLRKGHRRVYIEARARLWTAPAAGFFQTRRLPYYLVEVNAGAGLNLAADLVAPLKGFASDLIAARVGLDPQPLQLEDINHRRWLTAGIMPDQTELFPPLDKAIEAVRDAAHKDPNFIQLVECKTELAPRFISKNIPADDQEVGLLVYNMGTTVRMDDAEYESFRRSMTETMTPWGDRALWVEVESVRGELYSTTYQLRVHRLQAGSLFTFVAASFDLSAQKTEFNAERLFQFLAPPAPAK